MIFGADEGNFIINKQTGSCTPIKDDGHSYTMDVYVPKGAGVPEPPAPVANRKKKKEMSRYARKTQWMALITEDDDDDDEEETFHRPPVKP